MTLHVSLMSRTVLAATLLVGAAAQARAVEPVQVVTESLPPFSFVQNGAVEGLSTQIVQRVFERANVPQRIEVLPWQRALHAASTVAGTFIYSLARNAEREHSFAWIGKLEAVRLTIFRLSERTDLAADSFAEMRRKGRVVVVSGDASMQRLQSLGFGDEHFFVLPDRTPGDQRFKLIERGRAEYWVSNPYSLAHRIKTGEMPNVFARVIELPSDTDLYLAAHRDTEGSLVERLRAAFAALEAEGALAEIRDRFKPGS